MIITILIVFFALSGLFFFTVAAIGMLRLPDVFTRAHALGVMDTMGMTFMLVAVALYHGLSLVSAKIIFIVFLLYLANPVIAHAVLRAAVRSGLTFWSTEKR